MTTTDAKLLDHLDSMRCVGCGGRLEAVADALGCTGCGQRFAIDRGVPLLLDEGDRADRQSGGPMEALFRFPSFYRLKFNLLSRLNRTEYLSVDHALRGRRVLDVGCGPFAYGYDPDLPASVVGIDMSEQFVRAIGQQDPESLYLVANARKIPFADDAFDTALLRFVIHHIPGETSDLLREVARVTSGHIVIYDHVRSDIAWQERTQTAYWKAFDSGYHYHTMKEWDEVLRPYRVVEFRRTGLMFGNVCQILIDLRGGE